MSNEENSFFSKEEDGFTKNWYSYQNSDLIIWEKNNEIYSVRFIFKKDLNNEIVLDFDITHPHLKFYKTENQEIYPLKNNTQLLISDNKNIDCKSFIYEMNKIFSNRISPRHSSIFNKLECFVE